MRKPFTELQNRPCISLHRLRINQQHIVKYSLPFFGIFHHETPHNQKHSINRRKIVSPIPSIIRNTKVQKNRLLHEARTSLFARRIFSSYSNSFRVVSNDKKKELFSEFQSWLNGAHIFSK